MWQNNNTGRHKTSADLYEVQPYYRRFDQKNHFVPLSFSEPVFTVLNRQFNENLGKNITGDRPGYGIRDWAFYQGASANLTNTGFFANAPNGRGNSWQPLDKSPIKNQGDGRLQVDASAAAHMVRQMALMFGADDVGCCMLDRRWVFSHWFDDKTHEHYPIKFSDEPGYESYQDPVQLDDRTQVIPEKMKYVVVMLHAMDERGMAAAPTLIERATTRVAYSRISFVSVSLAEFIRGLGYNAIPSANCTALSIPLAVDAGLGELGRNAKLITPRFGPRCRISKVITDLPLEPGSPHPWGVTEFCDSCRKCARNCPAGAISLGERSFEPVDRFSSGGILKWQLDHLKCYQYWVKVGTNCGICIRTCPYNKSSHWGHSLVRGVTRMKNRNIDSLLTRMDDLLGYGKFKSPDEFWSLPQRDHRDQQP